jgi:hypothetical protein
MFVERWGRLSEPASFKSVCSSESYLLAPIFSFSFFVLFLVLSARTKNEYENEERCSLRPLGLRPPAAW